MLFNNLSHYFAECQLVKGFWESLKRWFLRVLQFDMINEKDHLVKILCEKISHVQIMLIAGANSE